jgi:hypothetical protein
MRLGFLNGERNIFIEICTLSSLDFLLPFETDAGLLWLLAVKLELNNQIKG